MRLWTAALGCATLALGTGCFDSGASAGNGAGAKGGNIRLEPSINGAAQALLKVAPSGAAGVQSFQVAVSNIALAKELTTSGSGWSNIQGMLNLYQQDIGDHNVIDSALARDPAWRSHFIDFCDPASIGRMATSQPFTARDTGAYHWAVVNWAPFFRVRATIPLGGGDTAYTHDGFVERHTFPNAPSDAYYYVTRPAGSLLQGPAEEAVVRKNNGGTWFRFLRPLRLTEADLDSNNTIPDTVGRDSLGNPIVRQIPSGRWNVLLVFNPQDLLFAGAGDSSNESVVADIQSADSSAYFRVPFLKATAVPYREGEDVMRETYEFTVTANEAWMRGRYGMRLELYLIGDNVVAATVNAYPVDGELAPPEVPVIFFAEAKSDGSLSLQDYDHTALFDGFVRKAAVGDEGTVPWDSHGRAGLGSQTLAYRLAEIKKMN
jgi:hypothetical protein